MVGKLAKKTPFYDLYAGCSQIVEFAGFDMPMAFEGIIPEALAARRGCTAFDVSHMGRVIVSGGDAVLLLNRIMTADVAALEPMQAKYSLMLNEQGGVIDDLIIYYLEPGRYLIVCNASNRSKNLDWLSRNAEGLSVEALDISDSTFMLAVQGPLSAEVLGRVSEGGLRSLRRYRASRCRIAGADCLVSRTGYTGEDGFELISHDLDRAAALWHGVHESGAAPAGLGARDVLRIEAGLCLYGKELDESRTPIEAGLCFAVGMSKPSFIGRGALAAMARQGTGERLVGMRMDGRIIPREGQRIIHKGIDIGHVTSGTFSPAVGSSVAMGYASPPPGVGERVQADVRGRMVCGTIVAMPFYDPSVYGWKRIKR